MAVAEYQVNGKQVAMRNFHVPKRAGELKYWYRAARAAIPALPEFEPHFLVGADVDVQTIVLDWKGKDHNGINNDVVHRLIIARKRNLW